MGRATRATAAHWESTNGTVGRSDLGVLKCIGGHGEVRMGDLATALQVHPSVISRQVCALEKLGLVVRRADPDDGRVGLIRVTEEGRVQMHDSTRAFAAFLSDRMAGWDPDKVALAADLIYEISESLGASEPATTTEELTTV
ncbi:hypothetical protein VV02_00480 [Luteipulveratus mongoliensis]|uniref:HTH marR-type domain-containing protein n=1 Tax=Luteipulveratus mongoliensis TaxID=571913 RepID=A0A0K1JPI3_9MICO|nr:hypothetical protein VV02_00480 [Luteipulveratus mongoliensis]